MKKLLIIYLFMLTIFSCGTIPVEKPTIEKKDFEIAVTNEKPKMSDKAIKEEFLKLQNAKEMDERLDEAALKRIKQSILVVAPGQVKELHRNIKIRESQKSIRSRKIGKVDRSNCDNPAISQCGGTCTSHGITNAMDNLLCKPSKQDSSNQHLWSKYKQYSTWTGIKAAAKVKICESKYYPNCGKKNSECEKNSHIGLKSWKYLGNNIDSAIEALNNGHPLVYSGKVTKSWAKCDAVLNPNSSGTSGGHAVAIVGYSTDPEIIGGGYFKTLNSWGRRCGDRGYQYLPFHYMKRTDGGMYGFTHEIKEIYSKHKGGNVEPVDPVKPKKCWKERECSPWKRCKWVFWKKCRECGPWKTVCED